MHGRKARRAAVAAYGSSGLVEESAQGGELEERVERHVLSMDGQAGRRQWGAGASQR